MAQSQFSLSWSAYKSNICTGLSSLQQNGEFVDMTLAADGHHVKVHQVIMALASPYIKDLMASAQCPHPVIFLNKISYSTLSAILEYIYTGEVLVEINSLPELIEAGKELHIKGLEDMNFDHTQSSLINIRPKAEKPQPHVFYMKEESLRKENEQALDDEYCFIEVANKDGQKYTIYGDPSSNIEASDVREEVEDETLEGEHTMEETTFDETIQAQDEEMQTDLSQEITTENVVIHSVTNVANDNYNTKTQVVPRTSSSLSKKSSNSGDCGIMQYTVSNQGSLQLILNRFIYYLKHTKRCGTRQWRCVDYLSQTRCPALVITNDDVVVQRISAHVHSFHDLKILKKVKAGAVFTAIHDAMQEGKTKKVAKENAATEGQQSD